MSEVYLSTVTGNKIDLIDVNLNKYCIHDIAHGLSFQCRWNGQINNFYSVAEHSVEVSKVVPKEFALQALLHDAPEAFIGDMPRPAKRLCKDFEELDHRLLESILKYFGTSYPLSEEVKIADGRMLMTEQFQLRNKTFMDFENFNGVLPYDDVKLKNRSSKEACNIFLNRFYDIKEEQENGYQN